MGQLGYEKPYFSQAETGLNYVRYDVTSQFDVTWNNAK